MNSEKVKEIVVTFMKMLNTIKMYHWKTYSYSQHQATDMLYKDLNKYIDEFVEVLLGKTQTRIPTFDISIPLKNTTSIKKEVFEYRKFLTNLDKDLKKHTDLLSIRDEILASINQFLYLTTFSK